ncbi:MAG: FAD-binding oxidoreductase, partial [Acidimicrobiia bacterium]|nr:FAD-binding oxidoreductase [Acidimicrobiia bacterium]
MSSSLELDLRNRLGDEQIATDPLDRYVFGKDAGIMRGDPRMVVFPRDRDEVVQVMRTAGQYGVPVVPRGSGTGLTGGAVTTGPHVLMVTTRMNRIGKVDVGNRCVWVQPGVINLDLSLHTARYGLHYAPDPSSQSICTIGGNLANNSGGPHCLAEGTTVNHVMEMEIVTADGEVLRVGGPAPDPIGLDMRGLLVGSEGTLGIVTEALVNLLPDPPAHRTILLAFDQVE